MGLDPSSIDDNIRLTMDDDVFGLEFEEEEAEIQIEEEALERWREVR